MSNRSPSFTVARNDEWHSVNEFRYFPSLQYVSTAHSERLADIELVTTIDAIGPESADTHV